MKEEINSNTIIVGDFNTPLTTMDRSTKQKINKETQTLNDTMDQLDIIDIYRTLHNDQRINPRRRYNNYKYICTKYRSIAICKTNANKYERGN